MHVGDLALDDLDVLSLQVDDGELLAVVYGGDFGARARHALCGTHRLS